MKEKRYFNYTQRWKLRFDDGYYHGKKRRKTMAIMIAASAAVIIIFALPWLWQFKLNYDLKKTEQNIIAYREVATVREELDRLKADISQMENFLHTTEERSKDPKATLEQLVKLLPEGTQVGAFSLQADHSIQVGLVLRGPQEVARLWINIRNSGLYEGFDMQSVSLVDQSQSINLTLKLKR